MKSITCNIAASLYKTLKERMDAEKESCDHVVSAALSQYLRTLIHTLFQVSTSAALIDGVLIGIRVDYHDNHMLFEKVYEHLLT